MEIILTHEEKKFIDNLHAFNSEGEFYFGYRYNEDMFNFNKILYFMYGEHTLKICYENTNLYFKNVVFGQTYKYEDFTEGLMK